MDIPSKYFEFLDDRSIMSEDLEEMGFERVDMEELVFYVYGNPGSDDSPYLIADMGMQGWEVLIGGFENKASNVWKTVGSVKMLIETLKGDKESK